MPRSLVAAAALLGLASGALAADNTTFDCTFSGPDGYLQISQAKNSCSNIVLDSLQIPGGVTLNLEKLNDGTTVSTVLVVMASSILTTGSGHLRGPDYLGLRRVGRKLILCLGQQYHR